MCLCAAGNILHLLVQSFERSSHINKICFQQLDTANGLIQRSRHARTDVRKIFAAVLTLSTQVIGGLFRKTLDLGEMVGEGVSKSVKSLLHIHNVFCLPLFPSSQSLRTKLANFVAFDFSDSANLRSP